MAESTAVPAKTELEKENQDVRIGRDLLKIKGCSVGYAKWKEINTWGNSAGV